MEIYLVALVITITIESEPEYPKFCPYPVEQYHAVLSSYDPALGDINCDGDCGTVAMGLFNEAMYKVAGACPLDLYGATVYFPLLGREIHCVDTGPAITARYSTDNNMCGAYFDILWPLHKEPAPEWAMYWTQDWEVVDWTGAWNWYQEEKAQWEL